MVCGGLDELRRRATLSTGSEQTGSVPHCFRRSSHSRSRPPGAPSFAQLRKSDSGIALGLASKRSAATDSWNSPSLGRQRADAHTVLPANRTTFAPARVFDFSLNDG